MLESVMSILEIVLSMMECIVHVGECPVHIGEHTLHDRACQGRIQRVLERGGGVC